MLGMDIYLPQIGLKRDGKQTWALSEGIRKALCWMAQSRFGGGSFLEIMALVGVGLDRMIGPMLGPWRLGTLRRIRQALDGVENN